MKKKVLIVALAVCLVAIMAFGTLAYFSAQDNITNKFMIASYDPENPDNPIKPSDIFSVKVEETLPDGTKTPDGIAYEDIQPGDVLDKDPTITNTGKYDQYIRVNVTVTNASAWKAACVKHGITDLTDIFGGYVASEWTRVAEPVFDAAADTLTYTYYYNGVLAPEASVTLFKTVTIPACFDVDDMVSLKYFELSISADAIQSANTGANAVEAFTNCWGK